MESEKTICVGIDLGTTNSVVAWYDNETQTVKVCPNEFGNRTTPSYVAFSEDERLIGETAIRQQARNPTNTIYESKRFIGKNYADCAHEASNYPYEIVDLGDGNVNFLVKYQSEDRIFCPEEIGGLILMKMASIAAEFCNATVTQAVITVPAYFNDAQRQATRDAGRIAGLDVLRIINEPTAAAIAYGIGSEATKDMRVLVCDIGGGTTDISLLEVTTDGIFEVLAIKGDTHLGGADFDQRLIALIQSRYETEFKSKLDLNANPRTRRRIREACERVKCELSAMHQTTVELDAIGPGGEEFVTVITRAQFNNACSDLFDKIIALVAATLQDASVSEDTVDEIVLVGGSTRVLRIQEMLSEHFHGKVCNKSINPDEAVAWGAAIQAAVLTAAQTGEQVDEKIDVVLLDVCPLSLGVETTGGVMSTIISRNSKVPVKKSRVYSTTDDNQTEVSVTVYEGERSKCSENRLLGNFDLKGIQPAPRGAPKIRVSFELDADGIFTVTATDESEVKLETEGVKPATHTLTIQNNKGRLSEEEVNRIVKNAEQQEAQDVLFRRTVKARTELENLLYGVRRTFSENQVLQDTADEDTVKCVLDIVTEQFEWLDQTADSEPSNELVEELERRREYVEIDVARPVVDAVNTKIRDNKLI